MYSLHGSVMLRLHFRFVWPRIRRDKENKHQTGKNHCWNEIETITKVIISQGDIHFFTPKWNHHQPLTHDAAIAYDVCILP